MMTMTRQAIDVLRKEYPVRVYQMIAITVAILTIVFGGIYGSVVYVSDQADTARDLAQQVAVESDRDLRNACELRVESRALIRGQFIDVYDALDELGPGNGLTPVLRERLDAKYPELSLVSCPPVVVPPQD